MPLNLAQQVAWNLAKTLMTCVVLFRAADGYGVMPTSEYDGDASTFVHEFDPWEA